MTGSSQNGESLLAYALSRLRPEIFTHPIWVHFVDKEKPASPRVIENILAASEQLQDYDPASACQVLLSCAALQNDGGQREEALRTIQQTLSRAERAGLIQGIVWAMWGACAISVQAGNYEQAARHLKGLQTVLRERNDWILADYVEIVTDFLSQSTLTCVADGSNPSPDQPPAGLMRLTLEWLLQWGSIDPSTITEFQSTYSQPVRHSNQKITSTRFLSDSQLWQKHWHTIRLIARGELRLQWVVKHPPLRAIPEVQSQKKYSPPPNSLKRRPFSSPSSLHIPDPSWIPADLSPPPEKTYAGASLLVYCLGPFRVYLDEQPIEDWLSSKGKAVFKYLVTHREHPVVKDVLMELFWPGISAESARNNLNVAIYGLRRALRKTNPSHSHVLFVNDCYLLNPELHIWLDYEAFVRLLVTARKLEESGDLEATISAYSKAETLYQGEFLAEDRYEDWLLPLRENLQAEYLSLLDRLDFHFFEKRDYQACIHLCRKMLAIDPCSEEAHRHLMQCFFERGQPYMALRQYYLCVEALKEGLNVAPSSATKELFEYIHRHS